MEYGVSGWMFSHRDWIEDPIRPTPIIIEGGSHLIRVKWNMKTVVRPSVCLSGVAMAGDGMNGGAAVAPAAVTD